MTTWLPDSEMDSAEYDDSESAELYDDSAGEDYDQESRSATQRRQERERRVALRRQREAQRQRRGRPPRSRATTPTRTTAQQAVSAIKSLDLETKVQDDAFRAAISAQGKRMSRAEYAAVASVATNQIIESFKFPKNPFLLAATRVAPLWLLKPQSTGPGFGGLVKDPRVIGTAAVLGIAVAGENRHRFFGQPKQMDLKTSDEIRAGDPDLFIADVFDGQGKLVAAPVTWTSDDKDIVTIDPVSGRVTAGQKTGIAVVTASADGIVRRVRVKVVPAGGAAGAGGAPPAGGGGAAGPGGAPPAGGGGQ